MIIYLSLFTIFKDRNNEWPALALLFFFFALVPIFQKMSEKKISKDVKRCQNMSEIISDMIKI